MRWTIWDDMRRMQDEMEYLFSENWGPFKGERLLEGPKAVEKSDYRQAVSDIWETDKEVVATVELPGVNKDEIKINATDDQVEIRVEKKDEHKEDDKKKGIYRLERSYSGFYRCFRLPEHVDSSKVDATYKNGVLELKFPKKAASEKRRQIAVR